MRRHCYDHTLSLVSFCLTNSHWAVFIFIQSLVICPHRSLTTSSCQALTTGLLQVYQFSMPCLCSPQVLKKNPATAVLPRIFWGFLKLVHLPHHSDTSTWRPFCFTGLDLGKRSRKHMSCLFSNSPKLLKIMTVLIHHWNSTKEAGRRPPTKTQAVFDSPLTSSPSVWRLLSQSRQFLLSSKANQALSVPAPALFSHPPPLPELGFWNSTAKNWLLQFSLSPFSSGKEWHSCSRWTEEERGC